MLRLSVGPELVITYRLQAIKSWHIMISLINSFGVVMLHSLLVLLFLIAIAPNFEYLL